MNEIEIGHKRTVEGTRHNAESSEWVFVCVSSVGLDLMIITDPAFLPMAAIYPLKSRTSACGNQGSSRSGFLVVISAMLSLMVGPVVPAIFLRLTLPKLLAQLLGEELWLPELKA